MQTPIMGAPIAEVDRFIRWFGVMAVLNTDLSVAELVEVADALLAAPILTVAVALAAPAAQETVAALHERHHGNLLIGASHVAQLPEARAAVANGAQFLLGDTDDSTVRRYARDRNVLYVPRIDPDRARNKAEPHGDPLALWLIENDTTVCLPPPPAGDRPASRLAAGALTLDNAVLWTAPTVAAAAFGYEHVPGIRWNATDFIVRARELRTRWEVGAGGR